MSERYLCPMCNGEGHVTVLTFREDAQAPWRIIAYGLVVLAVLGGGALLYSATTPRNPTLLEQCSQSCGQTRFKQYTEGTASWVERIKGNDPDINHSPVPGKCECAETH